MTSHPARRHPIINSPGTRRLAAQIGSLERRQPTLDDTIQAIRSGDDRVLHALVVRAQGGESDAAVAAIWALLPRLAAVVINRLPINEWHQGVDDYITFAYLTIVDVDQGQSPLLLGDKIISRTRRRYERLRRKGPPSRASRPCSKLQDHPKTALSVEHSHEPNWMNSFEQSTVACWAKTPGRHCSGFDSSACPELPLAANARSPVERSGDSSNGRKRQHDDLTTTHASEAGDL